MCYRWSVVLSCFVAIGYWIVPAVHGQESSSTPNTISIGGRGKIKVRPNTVELTGTISFEAELAGDSLTKFRTAKQSVTEAIPKLGIANLTLEFGGFAIGPAGAPDSTSQIILSRTRGAAPESPKVVVQELVRLRLKQIDQLDRDKLFEQLAKIIDAAKDAGVTFGPTGNSSRITMIREDFPGFAIYSIDNLQAVREQAENLAIKDARERAERLANLAGCRLGEIRSMREAIRSTDYVPSSLRSLPPEQSAKLDEIEITAALQVDFKLVENK